MIVPMKHITLLTRQEDRGSALEEMRVLGVMHLESGAQESSRVREALERVRAAEHAAALVAAALREQGGAAEEEELVAESGGITPEAILALEQQLEEGAGEIAVLERIEQRYAPFGEFDPASMERLAAQGVVAVLFKAPASAAGAEGEAGSWRQILHRNHEGVFGVQFGSEELPEGFERVALPPRPLAEVRRSMAELRGRTMELRQELAAAATALRELQQECDKRADAYDFASAYDAMATSGALAWLTGYVPAEEMGRVLAAAKLHGWGVLARDPLPGESVPTLLRPPKIFAPFIKVFDFLGINPAYSEADISGLFYIFFTLFFAMLIGDAGYGATILGLTLWAQRKAKRPLSQVFTLFKVFAVTTIVWGVMTASYFGISSEHLPPLLNHGVASWLGEQNNIMLVCFAIGAVHMSLGHIWNAICFFPDSRFLAQVGWCGIVATMFCAACAVVGIFAFPTYMLFVAGVSFLLIVLFMLKRHELRTNAIDLGMLPLDIISTLGDIISYVRLFAVATASMKLASMFNEMALGLSLPLVVKIPAVVLILALGHGLNLAMGALSILVHAIRLNTLEFSNHKGITWAGFAYKPLRRRVTTS